jgi:hypothetical protein
MSEKQVQGRETVESLRGVRTLLRGSISAMMPRIAGGVG